MDYPEHERLSKVRDKSQAIGEFLEWLNEQDLHLARYDHRGVKLEPVPWEIQNRLADFFGIDLNVLEDEKRTMLDEQRKLKRKWTYA